MLTWSEVESRITALPDQRLDPRMAKAGVLSHCQDYMTICESWPGISRSSLATPQPGNNARRRRDGCMSLTVAKV